MNRPQPEGVHCCKIIQNVIKKQIVNKCQNTKYNIMSLLLYSA